MTLNSRMKEFARLYVKHENAAEAAREAGYAQATAKQAGYNLLRNPAVQAEIARLRSSIKQAVVSYVALGGNGGKPPPPPRGRGGPALDGDLLPPEEQAEAEAEADLILSRVFVVERLMRNARICMGEEKVTVTRVLKAKGQDGKTEFTAVETEVFERDAAGANRALELLNNELNRLHGVRTMPDDNPDTPATTRNPELAAVLERFTAAAAKRGIHLNGATPAAAMNGATNGKGH